MNKSNQVYFKVILTLNLNVSFLQMRPTPTWLMESTWVRHSHGLSLHLVMWCGEHISTPATSKQPPPPQKNQIDVSEWVDVSPAGFRRTFRLWRRTSYRKRRQSCTSCSPSSSTLSSPYEEVALYQRPPQENHRLIILVGERLPRLQECNSFKIYKPFSHDV